MASNIIFFNDYGKMTSKVLIGQSTHLVRNFYLQKIMQHRQQQKMEHLKKRMVPKSNQQVYILNESK